jgi:hypothetical protein
VGDGGDHVVEDPRGGFVLALVVLLLFGIGVAGAVGYQVALNEAVLSVHAKETQTALSIARAGLRSYVSKQLGVHDTIVTYSIEGGDAVVSARLVSKIDSRESLYLLSSEGVYTDPTFRGTAARRTVYQYAKKREVAVNHIAAFTQLSGDVRARNGVDIYGDDRADVNGCTQPQVNITAVAMGSPTYSLTYDYAANITGVADSLRIGSPAAVLDSLGLDWDLLTDPAFPVDYQGVLPDFSTLPADSFPVIRFNNLSVTPAHSGRGVLIVEGTLDVGMLWEWDGIVLAGYFNPPDGYIEVEGLVVSGLDGMGGFTDLRRSGVISGAEIHYHRCYAYRAGRALSHFQTAGGTWWEDM